MYCADCNQNWRPVPGKRYFKAEPAIVRESACKICPACDEKPDEVLARQGLMLTQNTRACGARKHVRLDSVFWMERGVSIPRLSFGPRVRRQKASA